MKSIYKYAVSAGAAFALMLYGGAALADGVNVEVNGTTLSTSAQIINDRTMVPLRAVSNALGCGVAWDADNRGILIYRYGNDTNPDTLALCWIDRDHGFSLEGLSLGRTAVMETPPMIINDSTYVPLRAVSELLGAEVSWNGDTRTASVSSAYVPEEYSDVSAGQLLIYEQELLSKYDAYSAYADKTADTVTAEIKMDDGGEIVLELYPELAPKTVDNFVKLAEEGYYDGLIFHRVINNFMIQGGGYDVSGGRKGSPAIEGEFIANGFLNLIPHNRGAISMARTAADYNSASDQFFIVHADSPHLDGMYAAFGEVVSGMEYVDEIAASPVDANDKPSENKVIESIEIID